MKEGDAELMLRPFTGAVLAFRADFFLAGDFFFAFFTAISTLQISLAERTTRVLPGQTRNHRTPGPGESYSR